MKKYRNKITKEPTNFYINDSGELMTYMNPTTITMSDSTSRPDLDRKNLKVTYSGSIPYLGFRFAFLNSEERSQTTFEEWKIKKLEDFKNQYEEVPDGFEHVVVDVDDDYVELNNNPIRAK